MLTEHTCDSWDATPSADTDHALDTINETAEWIKQRLSAGSDKSKIIATLCLDTDGAVCSWVKPEDSDPDLLRASVEQNTEMDHDDFDAPEVSGASERFPNLPLEVSYEPLHESPTSVGSRVAVIATPDVPARLLIDRLDAMGIRVDSVTTLWHAIALAWDPGARSSRHSAQRVVASSSPVTACIVVDPDKGIMVWSWSQAGTLIAGGSIRLPRIGGEHHRDPIITEPSIARIGADWLGWSSQLGVSPSRIHFVTPAPVPLGDDEHRGLNGPEIGNALARAWPGASIDFIEHNDPIGETLNKLASRETVSPLTTLSSRPGRAHRSMYRWSAAALIAASVAVGIGAWHFFERANDTRNQIAAIGSEQRALLDTVDAAMAMSPFPLKEIRTKVAALRGAGDPQVTNISKPVMGELDTISLVVGMPGVSIQSIDLTNFGATVVVRVDEIRMAEQIAESLNQIGGSMLEWHLPNFVKKGNQIVATYKATWNTEALSS